VKTGVMAAEAPTALLACAPVLAGECSHGADRQRRDLSKLSVFVAVVRRCGPHLIEATIIPAVLFYGCLVVAGLSVAILVAMSWSYGAMGRRIVRRQPVPPILVLAVIGITIRTTVALMGGSAFLYFLQPVLATVAMGGVFLISIGIGQPLIGRLACEFWPLTPEVAARPSVLRLFRRLTLLWAAVNLVTAAITMSLLLWLPLTTFVALKQLCGLAVTGAGVFLTISLSLRTARREDLASAERWPSLQPAFLGNEGSS
jgi:uncharacterized protein DUF3159